MRIKKVSQTTPISGEIVDSLDGNSVDKAPSVHAVNEALQDIYSTEEIKTNKIWIDGKPIYRKVIKLENYHIQNSNQISINCSNLETLVSYRDHFKFTNNSWYPRYDNLITRNAIVSEDGSTLYLSCNSTTETKELYIIIEYTKTTDTTNATL